MSGNSTFWDSEEDLIHSTAIQVTFSIIYTIIFVLGMFGNLLTCYVVFRNRDMQTVTNFFITNLALSDMLLCILSIPFTPLYTFNKQWLFGPILCRLVAFTQGTSVYVSTLTLTSIAVDRFFVIIHPFRRRMKKVTCIYIICCTWLVSIFAVIPYGVIVEHDQVHTHVRNESENISINLIYVCEERWPSSSFRKAYGGITLTFQFILPFTIIAVCYIKISYKLINQIRSRPGVSSFRREEAERIRKQRTNRMLIAMVLIFGLCWLPLNCVNLINDFSEDHITPWQYYNICFFIVHIIAMSSTCYNPFLYSWLNETFRKEFKLILPGFQRTNSRTQQTCNGNETVHDSLLTSVSGVRRCSSVRERRCEKISEIVTYNVQEEKVSVSGSAYESAVKEENEQPCPNPVKVQMDSVRAGDGHLV